MHWVWVSLKALLSLLALIALVACAQQIRLSEGDALPPPPEDALRLATLNVHYIDLRGQGDGRWSRAGWRVGGPSRDRRDVP